MNESAMFAVIRQTVLESCPDMTELPPSDEAGLVDVLKSCHQLHLLPLYAERSGITLSDEHAQIGRKAMERAIVRGIRQQSVMDRIAAVLQKAAIPFIPLKGMFIKNLYPQPWMRTGTDIDVLVPEADVDRAASLLREDGFETDGIRHYHEILLSYGSVQVELHFNLRENNSQTDPLLLQVWDYAEQTNGCEYRETPAFFAFHHMAHLLYHFINGGCGLKMFVDLAILRQHHAYDEDELLQLLDLCSLRTFYESVCALVSVWFEGAPHTEQTARLEEFVLSNVMVGRLGVNAVASAYHKGKARHMLRKMFPQYSVMCGRFPVLTRHPVLLPYYYAKRGFIGLFAEWGHSREQIDAVARQESGQVDKAARLLRELGIRTE